MKKKEEKPVIPYTGKAYAYVAIGLAAAAFVTFILSLVFAAAGIYLLIASVLLALGALSFANIQKKKNSFKNLKIIIICSYVTLALPVALFIGGIIWSAV
ncbi:MAG: hypothetical protein K2J83_07420 [Clostridia bacterium]|nr:hypothetical protein [Clostridia bacterium]